MSLDVYLVAKDVDGNKLNVYQANITHNLNKMANEAGIYEALWRPEDKGWVYARDIIQRLEDGLKDLKAQPEHFSQFNAANGWGLYEHFVLFVAKYLAACKQYPSAVIRVSR